MGKNTNFVSHKKSKLKNQDGSPQLPSASALVEGEIAINFGKDVETLSIKNESGDVVTFSSDNYYSEQKLGSAFTGANSAVTVTDVIEENNEIIYAALTDLDERKLDVSAYTPTEELWVSGTGLNSVVLKGSSGTASGNFAVAEGMSTSASGAFSHAEGTSTKASGALSHAEGGGTSATSNSSHAEGTITLASGDYSHAEGYKASATSQSSHAEGENTIASGSYSHAEGSGTTASGIASHAEGYSTSATGYDSHAEGISTNASGDYSHAEGQKTEASGIYSHAEGWGTTASGRGSHTEGQSTIANNSSEHASGQYNVSSSASTAFGDSGNTLFSVGNGTADNARHNAFEIRQNGDIYIVSGGSEILLQDNLGGGGGSITVDQVLDNTTSASTNPVSSKAVYDAVTDNELVWTNAFVTLSGTVSAHTASTEIHLVNGDRAKLNSITGTFGTMAYEDKASYSSATEVNTALVNKANTSDLASYADSVKYNSTSHYVEFYHGTTAGTKVFEYDASPFLIDGMVQNVEIKDIPSGEPSVNVTCLVISFNTDAGKQDINIPLTEIFDPSNYYTKSETSGKTEISTALGAKVNTSTYTAYTASTATEIGNKLSTSDFNTYSGAVDTTISSKASQSDLNTLSGTVTDHTADTTVHFTTGTVQTQIDNSISGKVNTSDIISAITPSNSGSTSPIATKVVAENELTVSNALNDLDARKLDASAYTPTDLSNYYTKSETSGATELATALGDKVNTSDIDQVIDSGTSASTNAVSTKAVFDIVGTGYENATITEVIESRDQTIAAALVELNTGLSGKVSTATTILAGTGLSGGGDLSANRTINLAMPTTYSAETYTTANTFTCSEPVVYALVRYTGTTSITNQVCPVSNLADGQQCNVIYQSVNNNAYNAVISTDYVEPDGAEITLSIPAGGYAEINYINIKGIIFVRGI